MTTVTSDQLDALDAAARAAAENFYAPYSNFPVGAAVLFADGTTFAGCNIENASYSLGVCAERCALFSARAAGRRDRAVAVAVICIRGDLKHPASLMPCGACRQVMSELLDPEAVISVSGVGRLSIDDLLPNAFALPDDDQPRN